MAPRPEMEVSHQGTPKAMESPTTLINSIRASPRSPRHPRHAINHRGKHIETPATTPVKAASPSLQRRRPLGEVGHFAGTTPAGSQNHRFVKDIFNFNQQVLACAAPSTSETNSPAAEATTHEHRPLAKRNWNVCIEDTTALAGDFAVTTAEIYQQECRSDYRGRGGTPTNDFSNENGAGTRGRVDYKGYIIQDDNSLAGSMSQDEGRDSFSDTKEKHKNERSQQHRTGSSNNKCRHNTQESKLLDTNISPPRVDRMSTARNGFEPQLEPEGLSEARTELLRLGEEAVPHTDAKLMRTLQDLKRQDRVIEGWKKQLERTQEQLDETFSELEKARKDSQEKQRRSTEMRARSAQERRKIQDLYEKEQEQRKELESTVSKLKTEIAALKTSLRNARNTAESKNATDTSAKRQATTLQAQIVDLKSQLAEAHATNIDDRSAFSAEDIEELRKRLQAAEEEVKQRKSRDEDIVAMKNNYEDSIKLLNHKIKRIENEANEIQAKLEENLKASIEEENQVRAEMNKYKANCQRLERERSRTRIHTAADMERLNKQIERARHESQELREKLKTQEENSKNEIETLKQEIANLKYQLAESKKESVCQAALDGEEKEKLESELKMLREEVDMRKQQLKIKSEEMASQAKRVLELETTSNGSLTHRSVIDLEQKGMQIHTLESERHLLKENEITLRSEIKRQQAKIEEEQERALKVDAEHKKALDIERSTVARLQKQLEEFEVSKKDRANEQDLISKLKNDITVLEKKVEFLQKKPKEHDGDDTKSKAPEASLKEEVAQLKAKLKKSEADYREEKARAEEERRISKEAGDRSAQEIEELRRENEKSSEDKLKLREELEELRKQLVNGIGGASQQAGDADQGSAKVKKLRTELALARARLAAAREQTSTFTISPDGTSNRTDERSISHESESSHEASFSAQSKQTSLKSLSLRNGTTCDQSADSSLESSWVPRMGPQGTEDGTTSANAISKENPQSEFSSSHKDGLSSARLFRDLGKTSLVDDDTSFDGKYRWPVEEPQHQKGRIKSNVTDLRRQLAESSRRLQMANSRLNGYSTNSDMPPSKIPSPFSKSLYRGINHQVLVHVADNEMESSSNTHAAEEVVTSESDGIEVQRIMYAEV